MRKVSPGLLTHGLGSGYAASTVMRRGRTGAALVLAAASMMACSSMGSSTRPAPVVVHGASVRSGTRLLVELEQGLGTGSTPGQFYTAKVIQPVLDDHGQPVIPEGSEVAGHVREVRKASGNTPAMVHLTVDKIEVHGV